MRGTKNLVLILLVAIIISMIAIRKSTSNPGVVVSVDPSLVLGVPVDDTFDVYVTADDAGTDMNLFLGEVSMSFNPAVLNVVDDPGTPGVEGINIGDTAPYLEMIFVENLDNATGSLDVTAGRSIGVKKGLNGTVQIAKITFQVMAEGSCVLHPYNIWLKAIGNIDIPVDEVTDGRFASAQFIYSCDGTGAEKSIFQLGETIYITGGFPPEPKTVDIYVVNNIEWSDGQSIGDYIYMTSVSFAGGELPVTELVPVGLYDIVVDYNQNGVYDVATDAVDDSTLTPGVMPDVHDVAITSVVPNATQVYITPTKKEIVEINVTVLNEGAYVESFDVATYYGNATYEKEIGKRSVSSLLPGHSVTLKPSFTWVADKAGTYTLFANTTEIAGETDTDDNTLINGDVTVIFPLHDIAVTNVTASPTTATPGEIVTINVTVENQGDYSETFNVTAKYKLPSESGLLAAPSQAMTDFQPASSETLSFSWNTTGVAPGVYFIWGFVNLLGNETDVIDNQFKDDQVMILGHDVAVTKVYPSPTKVTPGENVTIEVTVKNKGTATETFDVTAYYNTTAAEWTIGTQTVTDLVNGTSTTLTFIWNTTGVSLGNYTIKAVAETVPGETGTDDNTRVYTLPVRIVSHDIAITDVTPSPTEVKVGEPISINVTVVNEGDFTETFNVTVRYDENLIGTQTNVSLGAGASITLNFTWDTAGVDPGDYTIIAEAIVDMDNDPADNTLEGDTVTVKGAASDIFLYAGVVAVVAIVIAAMLIYVFRVRKPKPT